MAPPSKRRKKSSAVEEVTFDFDARSEYLTGFHKRKVQRIKQAQEQAAKQDRLDKLENRKRIREERKEEVEAHVEAANALLREASGAGADDSDAVGNDGDAAAEDPEVEWNGIEDTPNGRPIDHEDEYVDEDRYTTVTVETVDVSKDGLTKVAAEGDEEMEGAGEPEKKIDRRNEAKRAWTKEKPKKPKVKKKKFRYESKVERKITRGKERSKNKAQAKARRE